jgi:uncharacterized protein
MLKYVVVLSLWLSWFTAQAVEVTDLYHARVKVSSQSLADRNQAISQAMQTVLLKVGGEASLLQNAVIKSALPQYSHYLSQFSYQQQNQQTWLLAVFDEAKINQLFQKANLSIWGNLRPKILLWLLAEDKFVRSFISESDGSSLPALVQQISELKGLPISLPVLDIVDIERLQLSDFWGRFAEPVQQASSRYQAEAIVIIRISNSSLLPVELLNDQYGPQQCELLCEQQYAIDWSLLTEQQRFSQRSFGTDQATLLSQVLHQLSDVIYQKYAQATDDAHEMFIDVANVENIEQYVAISDFLTGLSSVRAVMLVQAKGSNRRFKLSLMGSSQALLASLKLSSALQQYIDPLAAVDKTQIPLFYWHHKP